MRGIYTTLFANICIVIVCHFLLSLMLNLLGHWFIPTEEIKKAMNEQSLEMGLHICNSIVELS